jgi:phosphonate degradation associated HDIG domain protein
MTTIGDEVALLFAKRGVGAYFGERVSMLEHMLQAAHFAEAEGAAPQLVIAALLHDVGHLVEDVPDDIADWHDDAKHEEVGGRWLAGRFGPEVSDPVRLHVPAKRYLCATDPSYFSQLSEASVITLKLQGGPMNATELRAFESEPFFKDAVRVRKWDDMGKVSNLPTRGLDEYRGMLEKIARPRS